MLRTRTECKWNTVAQHNKRIQTSPAAFGSVEQTNIYQHTK